MENTDLVLSLKNTNLILMKKYRSGFVLNTYMILMKNTSFVLKKYIYDFNEIYRFGFVLKKYRFDFNEKYISGFRSRKE